MTFSERYNTLGVIAKKIFHKSLTVSSQRAKTWRRLWKIDRFFMFFGRCDLVFLTFQKSLSSFSAQSRETTYSCQIWCKSVERRLRKFGGRKKNANRQKNIILPKLWKIEFLQKRKYNNAIIWITGEQRWWTLMQHFVYTSGMARVVVENCRCYRRMRKVVVMPNSCNNDHSESRQESLFVKWKI